MVEKCPRCGEERGETRWCAHCGLDSTPMTPTLPTQEAMDAGSRERAWFASHPERAKELEAQTEAAKARTRHAEEQRLANTRPASLADYRDPSMQARLARGWLIVVAAITVLTAALEAGHLNLIAGKSSADLTFSFAQQVDDDTSTLNALYVVALVAWILCAAFFIAWTWRVYKNLTALGAQRPRFGTGWAIGGWFVPILSLWRPKQIIDDVWRTSHPTDPPVLRPDQWRDTRTSALLGWWWGLFILTGFVDRVVLRMPNDTIEHQRTVISWSLADDVLTLAAAALAYFVISRLTNRQRERAKRLKELPGRPVSGSPPTAATAPAT